MNKNRGFTLIETIIGLFLISLIAIFLLPSLFSVYKNSLKIKNNSKILFDMQEVLEKSKQREIGDYEDIEDGFDIHTKVTSYNENLKYIEVKSSNYVLDVVVKK
ncbi:prepilin-type cleavage/methylation protein [Anaerococcus hydrogenalis]|nr:prepilin-type cleavage/methylation protein [Anaerococcus hydrogenalis]